MFANVNYYKYFHHKSNLINSAMDKLLQVPVSNGMDKCVFERMEIFVL